MRGSTRLTRGPIRTKLPTCVGEHHRDVWEACLGLVYQANDKAEKAETLLKKMSDELFRLQKERQRQAAAPTKTEWAI